MKTVERVGWRHSDVLLMYEQVISCCPEIPSFKNQTNAGKARIQRTSEPITPSLLGTVDKKLSDFLADFVC